MENSHHAETNLEPPPSTSHLPKDTPNGNSSNNNNDKVEPRKAKLCIWCAARVRFSGKGEPSDTWWKPKNPPTTTTTTTENERDTTRNDHSGSTNTSTNISSTLIPTTLATNNSKMPTTTAEIIAQWPVDQIWYIFNRAPLPKELVEKIEVIPQENEKEVCSVCLGMTAMGFSKEFQKQLLDDFLKAHHPTNSFSLGVTMAPSQYIREHSLRLHLKISKKPDERVPEPKEIFKQAVQNFLSETLKLPYNFLSPLSIKISFRHSETDDEPRLLSKSSSHQPPKRRKVDPDSIFIGDVVQSLIMITDEKFKLTYPCPPKSPNSVIEVENIELSRAAIYVAGRYFKLTRKLSQTPWVVDGERRCVSSVSEEICAPLLKKFDTKEYNFSSSGREDVDVRMVGNGRPFVVELKNVRWLPCNDMEMAELEHCVNMTGLGVLVRDLQIVDKDDLTLLKDGEENKKKHYQCLVWVNKDLTNEDIEKLNGIKDLQLQQKTPIRVLHRRNLDTRPKMIHEIKCEKLQSNILLIDLTTQAGTYIKEFVHGDRGRTTPNIGSLLGCVADLLLLDVTHIELDWPKNKNRASILFLEKLKKAENLVDQLRRLQDGTMTIQYDTGFDEPG